MIACVPELPMLRADPVCPAAFPIRGASSAMQGVVCRLMQTDAEDDPGLRMTPRALEVLRESEGGIYLNLKSDPSTVANFCHGPALPRACEADLGPRAHHTFCPVWEASKERLWAGKDGLYDEAEPEPTSMGVEAVASHEMPDPWAAARRGLDELAPERTAA